MNPRNINKVKHKIDKIQSGNFSIDDVEILLINIREYARSNKFHLLLEFCDFVAHPERNKGIIYEELDIFYSKFKYTPINSGDQLDYYNVPKNVFSLIFQKLIDQLTDTYLLTSLGKNATQLKNHIRSNLFIQGGTVYKAINENAIKELRIIQTVCNKQPSQIRPLSEHKLFEEIKTCISSLSKHIGFHFNEESLNQNKNNLVLCFLEIIQSCKIHLHDGQIAEGFIGVGSNNSLYEQNPKIENLNLSFTAKVPIQEAFVVFDVIQTSLCIGQYIQHPDSIIEWSNKQYTSGRMKHFKIEKFSASK